MTEQKIVSVKEKGNSYEFGKAQNRWKLYFEDAEDLKAKIERLQKMGFDCFPIQESDTT